ncbi:androgen-induced gene 1 protein-like [Ischnura elegans]|uniref:androgen-induced gene 1 protein-like n=1 Tax=Ischnura elegans TaxID=197161 RepID=UPI001ED889D0|nr:androgen-induced gene 1 protein-like [Ischnura elegans]
MKNKSGGNQGQNTRIKNVLRCLIHTVGVTQFAYALYFDYKHVVIPSEISPLFKVFGGKLKFLTIWNVILQTLYFAISLLNDIFGSNETNPKKKPVIRVLKDYLLASVAFPVSMFVCLSFWGIWMVDRELVFPRALDPYFPTWLNHVMHTNILVFSALDMFFCFRQYPTRAKGITGLLFFMAGYLVWTFVIFYKSGMWVYPILNVLSWEQRGLFFAMSLVIVVGLYFVGEFLNSIIWKSELKQFEHSGKQQKKGGWKEKGDWHANKKGKKDNSGPDEASVRNKRDEQPRQGSKGGKLTKRKDSDRDK